MGRNESGCSVVDCICLDDRIWRKGSLGEESADVN